MFRELFVVLTMTVGCSAEKVATVTPEPTVAADPAAQVPPPPPEAKLSLSVSSIYMVGDCPSDTKKNKSKRAKGDSSASYRRRCTQSTLQLSIDEATDGSKISIEAMHMLSEDGQELGEIIARDPTIWIDDGYRPWDEVLGTDRHRVAYKISVPNWTDVEAKIGGTSYGPMFFLEIKVESNGVVQTIRSPGFPRSRVEMMKT